MIKRLDSAYEPGSRSGSWRKIKNLLSRRSSWPDGSPGKGNRTGLIGSLLIGYYETGAGGARQLLYCGHVGTGFSDQTLRMLTRRLEPLRRPDSPFDGPVPSEYARPAVWVEPRLVIEVTFDRWTRAGRMIAPAYQGLRNDKDPADVGYGRRRAWEACMPAADKIAVQVDGRDLTLTNLAKELYPADGFTKAEVLDYYQRISAVLLPHVAGRPMTLKRYPDGVDGESFFAKHAPAGRPDWVRTEEIVSSSSRSRSPGEPIEYVVLDDLPTLMWAANLAALELHVPMWRFPAPAAKGPPSPAPEHGLEPDLLVFDLDPGAPATIVDCCRVAEALRPVLADADLDALPKTSGGKGLQLYASISGRGMTAEQASALAKDFAERLERDLPRLVVSRMTRSLRPGKVLIDWSQNNGSKTTVAPYSLRAREHPTVSTPVTWDEVGACRDVADLFFTAPDVLARVEEHGDIFARLNGSRRGSRAA